MSETEGVEFSVKKLAELSKDGRPTAVALKDIFEGERAKMPDVYKDLAACAANLEKYKRPPLGVSEFDIKYPNLTHTEIDGNKVDIQLAPPVPNLLTKPDQLNTVEGKVDVVGRIWVIKEKFDNGLGKAECYWIGKNGKMYVNEYVRHAHNTKDMSTDWSQATKLKMIDDEVSKELMDKIRDASKAANPQQL